MLLTRLATTNKFEFWSDFKKSYAQLCSPLITLGVNGSQHLNFYTIKYTAQLNIGWDQHLSWKSWFRTEWVSTPNICISVLWEKIPDTSIKTATSSFLFLSLQTHVVFEQIMPSVEPYPSGCQWSKHYITHGVHHISHIVWPGAAWNASPAQSFPPALRWSKCFQGQTTAAGAWNGKNLQLEINCIQDLGFIRHFLYQFILNQPSYSAQNPQKSSRKISEMWKCQTTVEERTPSASISIIHHFHNPDL